MKLTRKKLIWFEQMKDAIEERATFCTGYIHRRKIPASFNEKLSTMEVGGTPKYPGVTTVYKYIRGENNYLSFPTECLYSDEALARYRDEKEAGEQRRVIQEAEAKKQEELRMLARMKEKHPEFFSEVQ